MIIKEPKWKSWIVETTTPLFTPEQCQKIITVVEGRNHSKHKLVWVNLEVALIQTKE